VLLEERDQHQEGAAVFRKADERVKAWAKARDEERLTIGKWLLVKKLIRSRSRVACG